MDTKYKNFLKISHLNIRSVINKVDELKHFIYSNNVDIMSLNETFLTNNKNLFIEDYNVIRHDRANRRGGGVCLIVHKSIEYNRINPIEYQNTEHVTITVKSIQNDSITISSYYNPPDCKVNLDFLLFLQNLTANFILLGDLNAHHRLWGGSKINNSGVSVAKFIENENLNLLNFLKLTNTYQPPGMNGSVIDLAITTNYISRKVKDFEVTDEIHSDHLTLVFIIACKGYSNALQKNARRKHKIRCFDSDKFLNELESKVKTIKIVPPTSRAEIDELATQLTQTINDAHQVSSFDKEILIKNNPIFLPKDIISLIRKKRALYKQLQKEHNLSKRKEFNFLSREIKNRIIEHKQKKWQNFCDSLNDHSVSDTKLWSKIQSIDLNSTRDGACPKLLINGSIIHEESKISEAFASNLEDVFTNNQDPNQNNDWITKVNEIAKKSFVEQGETAPYEVSVFELKDLIKKIRGRGAPGPDGISNKLIKILPDQFIYFLKILFDASISLSHIPLEWKNANVVMISKPQKNKQDINSYRPISLLNTLSKLLEKVIQNRLNSWLQSNNILANQQCGFRRNRSTKEHHLRLIQTCQQAFNRNQHVGALFFDIEKAFDRVWINGLIYKLSQLKVPNYLGLWLVNYLNERSFQVKLNQITSSRKQIRAGVPQGSILGPTLFNIFFNDICETIKNIPFISDALYADDLAAWTASEHELTIEKTLQRVSNSIYDWSLTWRTKISTNKTVFTVFSRKTSKRQIILKFDNQPIKYDPNPTFLGITFDKQLLFNKHTDSLVIRAQRRLNMLASMRGKTWGMSPYLLIITYKVLIRSLFDYSSTALFNTTDKSIKQVIKIQNQSIRKAFYWPPNTTTSQMLSKANLSPITERLSKLSVKFLNKAIFYNNRIIVDLLENYINFFDINEGAIKNKKGKGINKTNFGKILDLPTEILNDKKLSLK